MHRLIGRCGFFLFVAVSACDEARFAALPGSDLTSGIFVVERSSGIEAHAFESSDALHLDLQTGDQLSVLLLRDSLEDLQLLPGKITPVAPDKSSRGFPEAEEVFAASFEQGRQPAWHDAMDEERSRAFLDFRFSKLSPEACIGDSRCYVPEGPSGLCQPCPEPDVTASPSFDDLPDPPERPRFLPCPEGWTTVEIDGLTVCRTAFDPEQACADDEILVPGETGCRTIGAPCPAQGQWPATTHPNPIYVSADAPPGGDGSANSPFSTLLLGLGAVRVGGQVVIAAGTYNEDLWMQRDGVELLGACPSQTVIAGTLALEAKSLRVSNISLRPSLGPALVASSGSTATVDDSSFFGSPTDNDLIIITGGASVTGSRLRLLGSERAAIAVSQSSRVSFDQIDVRQNQQSLFVAGATAALSRAHLADSLDVAIVIRDEGRAQLNELLVRRSRLSALHMVGGTLDISDAVFDNTGASSPAAALLLSPGARASFSRVRATGYGSNLAGVDTATASFTDVLFHDLPDDVEPRPSGLVGSDARVTVDRLEIIDVPENGISLTGGTADIRDLRIARSAYGSGVIFDSGIEVSLNRVAIESVTGGSGFVLLEADTRVQATNILIRDSGQQGIFFACPGTCGPELLMTRFVVDRSLEGGLFIGGPSHLELSDGYFNANGSGGAFFDNDSTGELDTVEFLDNQRVGFSVIGDNTEVVARSVVMRSTKANSVPPCGQLECIGSGVYVRGGNLDLSGFHSAQNAGCGIVLTDRPKVTVANGLVEENGTGACAESEANLDVLLDGVRYQDNARPAQLPSAE